MFAHELRDILTGRSERCEHIGENTLEGNVYFKDRNGEMYRIDFLEVDENENIILSESQPIDMEDIK